MWWSFLVVHQHLMDPSLPRSVLDLPVVVLPKSPSQYVAVHHRTRQLLLGF